MGSSPAGGTTPLLPIASCLILVVLEALSRAADPDGTSGCASIKPKLCLGYPWLGGRAGVKRFRPHDARRTFLTGLLDAGVDLSVAQKLAGHKLVTTTTRYDMRGDEAKREAVARVHIPFRRG